MVKGVELASTKPSSEDDGEAICFVSSPARRSSLQRSRRPKTTESPSEHPPSERELDRFNEAVVRRRRRGPRPDVRLEGRLGRFNEAVVRRRRRVGHACAYCLRTDVLQRSRRPKTTESARRRCWSTGGPDCFNEAVVRRRRRGHSWGRCTWPSALLQRSRRPKTTESTSGCRS